MFFSHCLHNFSKNNVQLISDFIELDFQLDVDRQICMDVVKKENPHCGFLQFYIQVYRPMWCWAKFGHKLNKTPLSKALLTVCLKHN